MRIDKKGPFSYNEFFLILEKDLSMARGNERPWTNGKGWIQKTMGILSKIRVNRGFTLIEILIVIAIIGILAAIAIPQLSIYRTRAYNSAAMTDLKSAAIAQEAYFVENERYCQSEMLLMAPPFNFYTSRGVKFRIDAADATGYSMVAYHSSGDVTYTATGPGGTIVP